MSKINDQTVIDEKALLLLQIELVKVQKYIISKGGKVLIIFEGRDAAGKDGSIKQIVEHLSPRDLKVVALGKPTNIESGDWYFQRYVSELPHKGQLVLFNRSWYNRAGVEYVMKFCTEDEFQQFMKHVNPFESMIVDSGIHLIKYYLDISKKEQAARLKDRETNPLKQWKISPIDLVAQKKWLDYSKARDSMLLHTNNPSAPWTVIQANNKKLAHINIIKDILNRFDYPKKNKKILKVDADIVIRWPAKSKKIPALEP
jgi:polyphosphate kinase 2